MKTLHNHSIIAGFTTHWQGKDKSASTTKSIRSNGVDHLPHSEYIGPVSVRGCASSVVIAM